MKSVYDLAKKHYPEKWNKEMVDVLYNKGRLTEEEYADVLGEEGDAE